MENSSQGRPGDRGGRPSQGVLGVALGVGLLAACVIVDIALDSESAAIVGSYVIAPFAAALLAGPALTGGVGLLALAAAAASPAWNMNATGGDQIFRLVVIVVGTGFAIAGAWARERSRGRSERLRLLDAVGAVADGSLPLSETLERVSGVIVPGFADLCMIDAIHDGRANRLATRVGGREDAAELEARIHRRPATLPRWLVAGDRPWRTIHSWWPRVRDEELRRMSNSDEDLEFLRSLGINSTIVVPLRARDRNLGTLTAVVAWSGRRYSEEDVRFAHILAGRIALALDNAGLFSDLESIERRMDTVMAILDEAIVIHGADGELVFANPAAARSLGYETAEEAVSKRASDLRDRFKISDESGRPVGAEALGGRQALAGQVTAPLILRIVDRRTSEERWVRTKARPIEGASGDVLYSVTAIEDVTDVKRAEFANRLLARTGELVSHSVDYVRTLEEVPKLLVPEFADWCSLDVPREDGTLERVAMAHSDPERMQRAQALRAEYPADAAGEHPVGVALRTGEAQVIQFDDDTLRGLARDSGHLEGMRAMGLGMMIVAPMSVGGSVSGAMTLINHAGSRNFDADDVELAKEIASRVALAIETARIAEERVRIADALQRELLPPSLPSMPGWEMATMYEPAGEINEVGGDFYEVFPVEAGWAVVLGDVSGRGAAAAALTAEARHTIRTAGVLSSDPCAGLYLLDENLRGRDDAALCSVVLLVLTGEEGGPSEVSVYLAGHPHPILLPGDGEAEPVGDPGPMLGIVDEPRWDPVTVSLAPGAQLVLYTDGVIEARAQGGERFGTERLRVGLAGSDTPQGAVENVRAALRRFGARAREDDAAVVAIRRSGGAGEALASASRSAVGPAPPA